MEIESGQPVTWALQNLRSTKSSVVGNSTTLKRAGLWLVGLWILLSPFESHAGAPRTLWLFQQMGRVSVPRASEHTIQIETDIDHIGDTPSLGIRLSLPVGPLELRAKGSQRLFLDLTSAGRDRHNLANSDRTAMGVEIARQFFSSHGHYGRFALEFLTFRPLAQSFFGILVHTGVLDSPTSPWAVGLSIQFRTATSGIESNLGVSGETERVVWNTTNGKIRLGGGLSWSHRLKDGPGPSATEHGVLTLGPVASWDSSFGELRARMGIRMWLDRDVPAAETALLSEFDPPSLNVFWTYRF